MGDLTINTTGLSGLLSANIAANEKLVGTNGQTLSDDEAYNLVAQTIGGGWGSQRVWGDLASYRQKILCCLAVVQLDGI